MRFAAPMVLGLVLAGCIPLSDGNSCSLDDDCATDEICTDVNECSLADSAPSWRITWLINGEPASTPGACADIAQVNLTISSSTETLTYAPIVCEVGAFGFAAIPIGYNTARVQLIGESGQTLGQASDSGSREDGSELVLNVVL